MCVRMRMKEFGGRVREFIRPNELAPIVTQYSFLFFTFSVKIKRSPIL